MRIALFYPWVYLKGGPERTFVALKQRSRHDWTILTTHYDREGTFPELKSMGVVELPGKVSVQRSYGVVLRAAATMAWTRLDLSSYGALVVGCDGLGSLVNFRNRSIPRVCLCFTPLRAVYDEAYRERHLHRHRWIRPFAYVAEQSYRLLDRMAWRHYEQVFPISETVRQRILDGGLAADEIMQIAYPGIDSSSAAVSDRREPFFFLPGRMMWTKNIELAIDAFIAMKSGKENPFRLVIAGMIDRKSEPYVAMLKERSQGREDIEFVGDPSDEQMKDLYERCYATLFTAFNEDWGLTPLEGMMRGKPVIAVGRGGPTETILHEETGLLVDANTSAFESAMRRLVDHPEWVAQMAPRAVERAKEFSWDVFIQTLDDYFDTLERRQEVRKAPVESIQR
jgi:glycosyltransferase involved in cell wall biosynthesis